jgi:hypothetical protein
VKLGVSLPQARSLEVWAKVISTTRPPRGGEKLGRGTTQKATGVIVKWLQVYLKVRASTKQNANHENALLFSEIPICDQFFVKIVIDPLQNRFG